MNPLNAFDNKNWTPDVEIVLANIASNSAQMSEHHKQMYEKLIHKLMYYKIPSIILSSLNSVFAVGLSAFIQQNIVSTITCLISLLVGCIGSVELYLSIQRRSDSELLSYRQFYSLSIKINAVLKLETEHRDTDGTVFLTSCLGEYTSLVESAQVNGLGVDDELLGLKPIK